MIVGWDDKKEIKIHRKIGTGQGALKYWRQARKVAKKISRRARRPEHEFIKVASITT
jgi:predicted RNase H-like nuclease (RuvC/YqgF family)